jgi:hypothetical protein
VQGLTVLMAACQARKEVVVDYLLSIYVDVEQTDKVGPIKYSFCPHSDVILF